MPKKRSITRSIDVDGEAVVFVPLANHEESAKLFADDFDSLVSHGLSDQWSCNSNNSGHRYVRCGTCKASGNLVTVACLILKAPAGQVVRYRDGDRRNLRRDNLALSAGRAGDRERAMAEAASLS